MRQRPAVLPLPEINPIVPVQREPERCLLLAGACRAPVPALYPLDGHAVGGAASAGLDGHTAVVHGVPFERASLSGRKYFFSDSRRHENDLLLFIFIEWTNECMNE